MKINTNYKIEITWIPTELGGRKHLPPKEYAGVAKFSTLSDEVVSDTWSVIIESVSDAVFGTKIEAQLRFLVPDAPASLLTINSTFSLIEGSNTVATVTTI